MAQNWDEYAADWEKDESTTAFAHNVFQQLRAFTDLTDKHILDFGCGTGLLTQLMSPLAKDIVALDSSEAMIEELDKKELDNVEPVVDALTRGLVAQHPAFRKQFDVVVASSVCAYVSDLQQSLDIVYSVLDVGGVFVHWDWLAQNSDSESGLTRDEITNALTKAGFDFVEAKEVFSIQTSNGLIPVIMGIGRK
ncbi:class I SAM-dependent DNA methyltransferase [Vibrio tritonius]|uniref:class I SAM-dependent DNA methyltransferase n=1 Tax=Vibrio tritonius TaxID=1435069 RepID=UPI000837CD84|nr:methyltransferase [Vibrio tritonius]